MFKIVVLYSLVAVILSIIGTYVDWRMNYSFEDLDDYFQLEFGCIRNVFIWFVWPLTLFIAFLVLL